MNQQTKTPPPPPHIQRNLRRECRVFLDLEEVKTDRVDVARSLLVKALEHCPLGVDSFRRRRVLILSHLGEESFVARRLVGGTVMGAELVCE